MEKEYILESPSKPIKYRKCDVFIAIRDKLKTVRDDHFFFTDSATGEAVRCGDIMNHMEAVASYLHQEGVRPGDHVVVYAGNCVQYPEVVLACWMAGCVPVCVNNLLTTDDLGRILKMTAARFVFTTRDVADKALTAFGTIPGQNVVVAVGDHAGCVNWHQIVKMKSTQPNRRESAPEDTALILFSSGTTGFPKAVEISHENMSFTLALNRDPDMMNMGTGLIFQPLSHIMGLGISLIIIIRGLTAFIMPRFDMAEYIRLLVKHKVTDLALVPPLALLLVRMAKKEDLTHIKNVLCGAAALPSEIEQELNDMLPPGVKVKQVYGMTEVCGALTMHKTTDTDYPAYSIGQVVPNIQLKFIDPESLKSLPFGNTGEICARGPCVMKGYMNNKEATKATIDSEGWLHTGDLGYCDENGYLFYVDRLKELIKYKGYQVAPAELENVILSHPDVADAAVVGVPDREAGELPTAWVVIKPAAKVTPQDIQAYVKGKVAATKQLRGGVFFVQAIPKSGSGKILRRQIRKEIADSKISKI